MVTKVELYYKKKENLGYSLIVLIDEFNRYFIVKHITESIEPRTIQFVALKVSRLNAAMAAL